MWSSIVAFLKARKVTVTLLAAAIIVGAAFFLGSCVF